MVEFQSTLSVRRATGQFTPIWQAIAISIHALRKESDRQAANIGRQHDISIHALRKESDHGRGGCSRIHGISIHALRKESDPTN